MDRDLKKYLDSGDYLPEFIRDHHDQKVLFKRLRQIVNNRKDGYTDDISSSGAQVYTIDIFLWFMAAHGYTLQKSRKKIGFADIDNELSEFEKKQRETQANLIKNFLDFKK